MKIYRYMSNREFTLLMSGETIVGPKQFAANTSSTGVCFLPEQIRTASENEYNPTLSPCEAFKYLSGIVSSDKLVEFEVNPGMESKFRKSYGRYASLYGGWDDRMGADEICTPYFDTPHS